MPERPFISQFTPQRTDPEALEQILVQRHDLLARSVEKLRESVLSKNKHHLLFIGQRGAGKSHLVTLIHHRLSGQDDLGPRMRFAWLNEDETSTSFLSLLIRIYRNLSERYPEDFPADALDAIRGKDPASARQILGGALLHHLGKRTIVLIFENLDSLFAHMSEAEQRTWRGFIQNHPVFATAATAQSLFDGMSKREKPFFGFFDTVHLKNLSVEEATELLGKISVLNNDPALVAFLRTPTGRARLRAVHHLSGGNPRLYIILSDFLTKEALDDLVRPFEEVVDRQLTSYYQERMRWLTPQQREIVQLLCREGHPIPVKDIAAGIFASHGSVTSQLKQLREMGYLSTHPRGREVYYELAEPLMRLSFQVKETNDRKPLELIVDFLRVWYDRADIEKRLERFAPGAEGRDYFEAALEKLTREGPKLRHELMRRDVESIDFQNCEDQQMELLRELAEETNLAGDWINHGRACYFRSEIEQSITSFTHAINSKLSSPQDISAALFARGTSYSELARTSEALRDFSEVIENPNFPAFERAGSYYQRGVLHSNLGHHIKAIADYSASIALKKFISSELLAGILIQRGVSFNKTKKPKKADADFSAAITTNGISPDNLGFALFNRGYNHKLKGRIQEALADYSRAIEIEGFDSIYAAGALFNRGHIYVSLNRIDDAIADFSRILNLAGAHPEQMSRALLSRGTLVLQRGSTEKSTSDCHQALALVFDESQSDSSPLATPEPISRQLVFLLEAYSVRNLVWPPVLSPFIRPMRAKGFLKYLGDVLVQHLSALREGSLNPSDLNRWVDDWETVAGRHQDMTIPLRMLRAGVEYITTKDEGSLLTLVKEERSIVRQALGLPEEEN